MLVVNSFFCVAERETHEGMGFLFPPQGGVQVRPSIEDKRETHLHRHTFTPTQRPLAVFRLMVHI